MNHGAENLHGSTASARGLAAGAASEEAEQLTVSGGLANSITGRTYYY